VRKHVVVHLISHYLHATGLALQRKALLLRWWLGLVHVLLKTLGNPLIALDLVISDAEEG
jgi:hypothetical protein